MKYGLEKEMFLLLEGKIQILGKGDLDGIPADECGALVEVRGDPAHNIIDAVFNLKAKEFRIRREIAEIGPGYMLWEVPVYEITRDFKRELRRVHSKGIISFQNMYDFADNRHRQNELTAAIHVSFTNPHVYNTYDSKGKNTGERTVNKFFDFIKYVKGLDKAFRAEIRKAKRNPGFYELKGDGRVEYRSLPCDIDLDKLITTIQEIEKD